jgi:predicted enzyme related to lactoylglutathione lyase
MSAGIEGLQAVTVHVTDLAKAREFYSKVLGLEEVVTPPNAPRLVYAIPGTPTRLVMHIPKPEEGGRAAGTVSGILFACRDPAAACQAIQRSGGVVTAEPWTIERDGAKIVRAVFADPDGNEFLLSSGV